MMCEEKKRKVGKSCVSLNLNPKLMWEARWGGAHLQLQHSYVEMNHPETPGLGSLESAAAKHEGRKVRTNFQKFSLTPTYPVCVHMCIAGKHLYYWFIFHLNG